MNFSKLQHLQLSEPKFPSISEAQPEFRSARMNFSNLQHMQLSEPKFPSISEGLPEFRLPASFVLDKDALPQTCEITMNELNQIPELAPVDACSFLLSAIQ